LRFLRTHAFAAALAALPLGFAWPAAAAAHSPTSLAPKIDTTTVATTPVPSIQLAKNGDIEVTFTLTPQNLKALAAALGGRRALARDLPLFRRVLKAVRRGQGPKIMAALAQALASSTASSSPAAGPSSATPTNLPNAASSSAASSPAASAGRPMVLGFYVPGTAAWQDLVAHASQITAIAPLWYSFRPSGSLNDLGSSATVTEWAHAHGIAVYPLVINGYGNDNMLQNPSLMQQDVQTLVSLAATAGYDGFDIDFESLSNADEQGLNTFVADLAAGLHQEGKKLIVSVGPRTSNQNGYHVYDYQSLGASADYVDLMLYDDHDIGSAPGPVAPMSWVTPVVQYAAATIPPAKVLVGLAGYGYNWAADGSTEISDATALALANQYGYTWVGGGVQEPEIVYTDANGYQHTVWFEDSYSEAFKVALVNQYHLGGVALWDLGEEDSGVWPMLAQDLKS
jgi:spore germination protein YaaH